MNVFLYNSTLHDSLPFLITITAYFIVVLFDNSAIDAVLLLDVARGVLLFDKFFDDLTVNNTLPSLITRSIFLICVLLDNNPFDAVLLLYGTR